MVGIIIGFSANLVFYAATFAGGIIDIDMGYQTSILFDVNNTTPTLVGTLKEMIVLMLFLYMNGHHQIIEAVYASLRVVPLTTFEVTGSTTSLLIKFATNVLIIAIKLAAPILVALFCTNLALALLARVAPQTNIFILSFQLKVAVGLIMLAISVPLMVYVSKMALGTLQTTTFELLKSINPARVP
jgi:flagellar biosynthetic protein FliR